MATISNKKPSLRAGIIGGAGYTGGEMIRLLINHPDVEIAFVHSKSNAGKYLYEVHEDLAGETDKKFDADWRNDIQVLFLCLGHGEAKKFLEGEGAVFAAGGGGAAGGTATATGAGGSSAPGIRIIDLSQDYRLHKDGVRPALQPPGGNGTGVGGGVKVAGSRTGVGGNSGTGVGSGGGAGTGDGTFIYGLPELNREQIRSAQHIANPGCFATAIQLGLLPLAKAGLLRGTEVYTTGITGSTGAGQGLSPTSHFSWRANNIQAYKTLTHQHLKEVGQSLQQLEHSFGGKNDGASPGGTHKAGSGHAKAGGPSVGGSSVSGSSYDGESGGSSSDGPFIGGPSSGGESGGGGIHFVPWRGDFTRGIFVSSQLRCNASLAGLEALYKEFYDGHPFTLVSPTAISLKQVINTNKCLIQLEQQGEQLVVHSAIDNLVKGASGQAVQNMNLLFGLDETAGLHLKANAF